MSAAYDFWKSTDPRDTAAQSAIEQLVSELARDASEVLDAANNVANFEGKLAAAMLADTPEHWDALRAEFMRQRDEWLQNRAIDLYDARVAA